MKCRQDVVVSGLQGGVDPVVRVMSRRAAATVASLCLCLSSALANDAKTDGKVEPKIEIRTDTRAAGSRSAERAAARESAEARANRERDAGAQQAFVTVNGSAQSVAMAELLLRDQLARGAADSAELRAGVRETLIANALMEQEARKAGLDRNALVQAQMDMARQRVLVNAWQQKVLAEAKIGDAEVAAEYNRQVQRMAASDYRIRQVLVGDELSAKLLLEKARAGSKIEDLAREYSREPNAKTTGGLSDWINMADLLPPLADAVKTAGKGTLLDKPVATPNGWHLVLIEDVRPFKAPALEDIKPQVLSLMQQRALQDRLKALRDKASVQ